jgi:hypothetical protein
MSWKVCEFLLAIAVLMLVACLHVVTATVHPCDYRVREGFLQAEATMFFMHLLHSLGDHWLPEECFSSLF